MLTEKVGMFERGVEFLTGYDKRGAIPDCGVAAMEIKFLLKGPKAVIQFAIYTDWYPKSAQPRNKTFETDILPAAYDIGYHTEIKQYEGQEHISESCDYLDGKPCYYDGSSLQAEPIRDRFINEGIDAVWEELEKHYNYRFGETDADNEVE